MPRINKDYYPTVEIYKTLIKECWESGDEDACSVIAACAVTGLKFAKVQELFRECGRKDKKGTHQVVTEAALKKLGYILQPIAPSSFIEQYPEVHRRALKSVTAHHPDRFPHVFRNGKSYLMSTGTHMFAVVNGEVQDYVRGSRKQVKKIWEVKKVDTL